MYKNIVKKKETEREYVYAAVHTPIIKCPHIYIHIYVCFIHRSTYRLNRKEYSLYRYSSFMLNNNNGNNNFQNDNCQNDQNKRTLGKASFKTIFIS